MIGLVWLIHAGPSIDELDQMASSRDVPAISRLVDDLPAQNPLDVLKTNGPYGVGSLGWHAKALTSPMGTGYVVLTTPLTSEDVGEVLLRRSGDRLQWVSESDSMGVQVLGHSLDLSFDLPNHAVHVIDQFHFRSDGSGEFAFRMGDEYKVASISAEGRPVAFSQAGGTVMVGKPAAGEATYQIEYGGVVNRPDFAGSVQDSEATLANEYWYPMVAREPSPYDLTVHAPSDWTVVGQGERLSDEVTGRTRVAKFHMALPIVYFSVSAGPYHSQSVVQDGKRFTCWSPRMSDEAMLAQAKTLPSIISFYSRFGDFPFSGYGDLDSPHYGGGALEAYSYATWGGGLPQVDAHEPSHTWWGGIIDNTYLHSFWNESFAVFSEGLYRREVAIGNQEERRQAFVEDGGVGEGYDDHACSQSGADRGSIANSLGYGKGAQVLQMLERIMGTDSMVAAMHRWVADQPKGKPGEWEDFEKAAEAERPDLHLEEFFSEWLDRPGHVDFDADASYGSGAVSIAVTFKGDAYRIPLEVLLGFDDGTTKLAQFDIAQSTTVSVPSDRKPAFVSIDPYLRLVRRIAADELPARLDHVSGFTAYAEPAHSDWAASFGWQATSGLPDDPSRCILVGSPETSPLMARLCKQVGFSVAGTHLTYDGTTIDLDHESACALVDLPQGGQCVIALGKSEIRPNFGRCRLGLFDELGRMLRGKTDAKTSGHLTFHFGTAQL